MIDTESQEAKTREADEAGSKLHTRHYQTIHLYRPEWTPYRILYIHSLKPRRSGLFIVSALDSEPFATFIMHFISFYATSSKRSSMEQRPWRRCGTVRSRVPRCSKSFCTKLTVIADTWAPGSFQSFTPPQPPHENLIWSMIWFGKNQIATNWHDPPFCCKIIHGFVKPNSSFTGLTGLSQCLKMDEHVHT